MTGARKFTTVFALVLLAGGAVSLAACNAGTGTEIVGALSSIDLLDYFQGDSNLLERDYAAADFLADRGHGFVQPGDTIKALPLLDIDEPRLVTKFGKEIPEQVGERLTQLGYKVDLTSVSTDVAPEFRETPAAVLHHAEFTLAGSYSRATSSVHVKLYIQDAGTGQERASFEFDLPRHGNVRRDSKPAPSIEQLPPEQEQGNPSQGMNQ